MIHGTPDLGRPKASSAADAVARLNPDVLFEPHAHRIGEGNARALVSQYDVVADGSDNFDTRYAVADACAAERKPLVTAALGRFDGSLTTLMPYAMRADGTPCPSYRDLFPKSPRPAWCPPAPRSACSARSRA